ncbi:MAG: MFS transporter, partial [Humibacter sp.]
GVIPVYRVALVAFTVASALCAVSPSTGALIAARVVQGLAGAPMVPLAMSMLLGGSGARRAVSPVAGVLLFLGPAIGPSIGGLLIGAGGWRWIFLVNLPIGCLAALAAWRLPPSLAPTRPDRAARFDVVGWLLIAFGLTALL